MPTDRRLGIGFIGAGFVTQFHVQSLVGVRDANVAAVMSPTLAHAEAVAEQARGLGVGDPKAYLDVPEMINDPHVEAIWICAPNHVRLEVMEAVTAAVMGGADLLGIACEKPLARNVGEARCMLELAEDAGLSHGYLENQVFAPSLTRGKEIVWRRGVPNAGRPFLARASEEHAGPHMPWFWSGEKQGGGVLNDMLCHSFEAARFLLTAPEERRSAVKVEEVDARIASLKWSRDEYARELLDTTGIDYRKTPSEDFARATVSLSAGGHPAVVEATTSWNFVGAVEQSAEDLNAANELAQARRIRLGYHNHYWEFSTKLDGVAAHKKLYSMLDDSVFAEIDTYWALVGGADPAAVLKGLGARAPFIHVKDGPADDPTSDMVAVGTGALDAPSVVTATSEMEWHIVELDRCATDMFEAVEKSFRFLTEGGYSLGQG